MFMLTCGILSKDRCILTLHADFNHMFKKFHFFIVSIAIRNFFKTQSNV